MSDYCDVCTSPMVWCVCEQQGYDEIEHGNDNDEKLNGCEAELSWQEERAIMADESLRMAL
jgi:hypothetical protein